MRLLWIFSLGGKMKNKEKTKFAKQGDKITEEYCPRCNEQLVVQTDSGTEVFVCDKCKFKIKKN